MEIGCRTKKHWGTRKETDTKNKLFKSDKRNVDTKTQTCGKCGTGKSKKEEVYIHGKKPWMLLNYCLLLLKIESEQTVKEHSIVSNQPDI